MGRNIKNRTTIYFSSEQYLSIYFQINTISIALFVQRNLTPCLQKILGVHAQLNTKYSLYAVGLKI